MVVAGVPLFAGLDAAAVGDVTAAAHMHDVPAARVFFSEGDPARAFFVVRSGSVKLTQTTAEGHVVVLRFVGPGDPFGGVAVFSGAPYPITAEAVTPTSVFEWSGAQMAALMERHARLALNALRFVASQLHAAEARYRQLATEKVDRRIARALLRLVQHASRKIDTGVLIDLPVSREDIAQMTGTTLYTVSRVLSRWESDGMLEAGRQRLVICNPHALVSIADDLV